MKKVLLALVFVLATGTTFMNANSSESEEVIMETTEAVELIQVAGCARDCVDSAFEQTIDQAIESGELVEMDDYMWNYESCYYNNCLN